MTFSNKSSNIKIRRKWLYLAIPFTAILIALFLAEGIVRIFDLDWRVIPNLLYYQKVDLEVHEVVDNPSVLYRIKPESHSSDGKIKINSLGFRGKEIQAKKPENTYRILCLGGSNVYGIGLYDDQTWPARLSQMLNKTYEGNYEVINGGVPAYVGTQMAALGTDALNWCDPDLVIIALSNTGSPAFLYDHPARPLFENHPTMLADLFHVRSSSMSAYLLHHVRLYRYLQIGKSIRSQKSWKNNSDFEKRNIDAILALVEKAKAGKSKYCFFLYPGTHLNEVAPYIRKNADPVFYPNADDLPVDYKDIHPPAFVFRWYAGRIGRWLAEQSLLNSPKPKLQTKKDPSLIFSSDPAFALSGKVQIEENETKIPGGTFTMGCSPKDVYCNRDEMPRHIESVKAFSIDRREVTIGDYRKCEKAGVCSSPKGDQWNLEKGDDHPVVGVSFFQARTYCKWNKKRLPTEAQWEFAARAATNGPWYRDPDQAAWFAENSEKSTHPVGTKAPNDWGLYDMLGNVWEWCSDLYAASPDEVPADNSENGTRVLRGGGWFTSREDLRASFRENFYDPEFFNKDLGFRCVK